MATLLNRSYETDNIRMCKGHETLTGINQMARELQSVRISWDAQGNGGFFYLAKFSDSHRESGTVDLLEDCSVNDLIYAAEEIAEELGGDGGKVSTLGMGNGCEWVAN